MPKSCLGKVKRSGKSVKHGQYRCKCSVFECLKIAVTNGLCHQHGAPRTTCKFIDWPGCRCKKQPKKNGMCKSHIKLTNWKEWLYKQSHEKIECDWGTSATKSKYNSDDISNDADNGVWDISRAFDSGDKQSKYNYIIDETAMTCDDGVAGKGVQDTTATSGVEKLNNIDASTIEIPSDDCGSDDYEMTFESGAMTSNDNDTDNYKAANATTSNDCNSNDIDDDSTGDDEGNMSDINPSICKNDKDKHSDKGNSPCRSARIKMKHDQVQTAVDGLLALSIRGSNGVPMLFKGVHIAPV